MSSPPDVSPGAGELSAQKRELLRQRLRRSGPAAPRIPRRPVDAGPPPLSYAQERLWFMEQFAPGTGAYTVPLCLRLRGDLDVDLLRRAVTAVVDRHDVLRYRFPTTDDGVPRVEVDPVRPVEITVHDLGAAGATPADRERAARDRVAADAARPFDLRTGPLLRVTLLRLAPADHVLLVATHHTVSDGWSTDVLADDLLAHYTAYARNTGPHLPDLPIRYGDYAAWQRDRVTTGDLAAAREYWRRQLAGITPLELPVDHPRGAAQTFTGASHHFRLDRSLLDALQPLADRTGATVYMTVLAAYQVLLLRHTGQPDFAVGSPVAGRALPELARLVGMFVNMLPMRAALADDPTFAEALTRVRDTALDAWSHQDLPFEQVVQELETVRDPSRSPVFQTVFVLQPEPGQQPADGSLTATRFPFDLHATRYDLELYAFPSSDGLDCLFVYNSDLFAAERIGWLGGHLAALLTSAAADPDRPVSRLDLLTAPEVAEAARRNDTAQDLGPPTCLHRLVVAQAARTPDAVAVRDARGAVSYAELDRRVHRLAGALTAAGARTGDLVAVVMERGVEQVVATLAVQLAGAAYLPVDPDLPAARRHHLVERGGCRLALTQPWLVDALDWPDEVRPLVVTDDGAAPGDGAPDGTAPAPAASAPDGVVPDPAGPDDLAYVIFTSGSTGDPKGVVIDHRAAVNTVRDINRRFAVGPADRVLAVSALSFDLSVYDVFGLLAAGGTLVMPEPAAAKDPAAWARWVRDHRITVWDSVPALMELLVEHAEQDGADLTSLRLVLLSGDWIPLDLPDRIRAVAPHAQVISLGGATEAAIWSICYPVDAVDPQWRSIPYGTPLANQSFHILDRHGHPVPVGVTGELHIGGVGVARGYWRDPERTAASFVHHPVTGERLYRTGDLGRYRPDGVIEFLGRRDSQVKIRGYRIELGEIEAHLSRCPGVADCVVSVLRQDGGQLLVGYVVPRDGAAPTPAELRGYLTERLAGYMVPSHYVTLPRLPLTGNGKVDRNRLPAPQAVPAPGPAVAGDDDTAPVTPTERAVLAVFRETLAVASVGLDDNFFDLGGHSVAAIQTVTRLRRALPGDPDTAPVFGVTDLFRHPTVREFAALIDRSTDGPADETPGLRMLHRLTPRSAGTPTVTYVCVPYGGGQPMVYQPLADALPTDRALYAVAIPGHDPTRPDEVTEPIEVTARRCADEIAAHLDGPLVLYGHCGIGGALAVETARCLEAAGRDLTAVCVGGIFPFARPAGRIAGPLSRLVRFDRLGGDRAYENRLRATGGDVAGLEPQQVRFMIASLRRDSRLAEDYFTRLLASDPTPLRAPIVSVVGERDVATDFHAERFREWHFLTATTALVVLDEAGHYFLRYRAQELAEILTGAPDTVATATATRIDTYTVDSAPRGDRPGWWTQSVSLAGTRPDAATPDQAGPRPGLGRFLTVAVSQLVSFTGTALTDFALPLWVYLTTGSLAQFAVFMMLAIVPGVFVAPLIGAVVDRADRRRVMIAGSCAAGTVQLVLGLLVWTDNLAIWHTYPLVTLLSVALTAHRLGYTTAVPQLVPKQYLGHANGLVQLANGIAQFVAPLGAVALLSTIGLGGILLFDLVGFVVGISILLATRFPRTMAYTPREPLATEIAQGFRLSFGNRSFRALIGYFALLNILLAPLLMSLMPLSLSFGDMSTAGTVSFIGGGGAALGGLVVAFWGGPARRRVRGMLLVSLLFGVFGVVAGVHPSVLVVGLGAFGLWGTLSVVNGIYLTVVHVKLPQRFHGRVIALNQAVAWSTLPVGFAVVAPLGERLLQPLMTDDGALAPTVGAVIGTGPGRGLGLLYVLLGVALTALVLAALRTRALRHFDDEVPDADPDDLVGARTVQARTAGPAPAPDRGVEHA
ncbi:non-ribosomal peptide synthetase/MFS transporter [Micromonospora echinofusca]|uniref:Amino acid adenylation domain-containing protein n=1 Tax=Micromonospora echinofusca TaxID=47858 RepID=A0ABS3VTX3_MICEH|nr:non-ribosomal peptide synthetase/MFS transporter [Micromonospora echinofusca]MBO4207992.1 amino acid adenylation domain-containing protein [Micromonospora echinofusca]